MSGGIFIRIAPPAATSPVGAASTASLGRPIDASPIVSLDASLDDSWDETKGDDPQKERSRTDVSSSSDARIRTHAAGTGGAPSGCCESRGASSATDEAGAIEKVPSVATVSAVAPSIAPSATRHLRVCPIARHARHGVSRRVQAKVVGLRCASLQGTRVPKRGVAYLDSIDGRRNPEPNDLPAMKPPSEKAKRWRKGSIGSRPSGIPAIISSNDPSSVTWPPFGIAGSGSSSVDGPGPDDAPTSTGGGGEPAAAAGATEAVVVSRLQFSQLETRSLAPAGSARPPRLPTTIDSTTTREPGSKTPSGVDAASRTW